MGSSRERGGGWGGVEGEAGLRLMAARHPPLSLLHLLYTFIDGFHLQKKKKLTDKQSSWRVLFHSQSELFLLVILFLHADSSCFNFIRGP